MNKQWTVGSILQWTQRFFAEKEIDTPRLDAEILLAHVLGKERIYLYAHYDEPMTPGELAAYKDIIKKRAARYPVARILGVRPFMGLDFSVSAAVLVPRPETELLVETVEKEEDRQAPLRILDMGTGSGAIIISLLHHFTTATGRGVDISAEALAVAKKNGEALCVDRVEWTKSDLFADVPAVQYDWLVSNVLDARGYGTARAGSQSRSGTGPFRRHRRVGRIQAYCCGRGGVCKGRRQVRP